MAANNSDRSPDAAPCQAEVTETRTDRRRRQTRSALLQGGLEVIADLGLDRLTIASITDTADVALGTFYNHFDDRTHFLEHLFIEATMEWLNDVAQAQREPFRTEADRTAASVAVLVAKTAARPAFGRYFAEALGRDELAGRGDMAEMMHKSIELGVAQGCFVLADPDLAARLAVGVLRQGLLHIRDNGVVDGLDTTLAETMLRVLGTPERFVGLITERAIACISSPEVS